MFCEVKHLTSLKFQVRYVHPIGDCTELIIEVRFCIYFNRKHLLKTFIDSF